MILNDDVVWTEVFRKRLLPLFDRVGNRASSSAVSCVCCWVRHNEVSEVRDVRRVSGESTNVGTGK
jgi:hypothetical protein